MKKIIIVYFLFPLLFLNISGCAPLIIGGAVGVVGGYAISKDTVQGETDKPYDILWNSALMISGIRGTIRQEDRARGYIELEIESSRVWIRLIRLARATTRLRISARKYHLPNMDLAHDIFTKVMEGAR